MSKICAYGHVPGGAPVDKDDAPCGYDDASGEVRHHHAEQDMCFAKRIVLYGVGTVLLAEQGGSVIRSRVCCRRRGRAKRCVR